MKTQLQTAVSRMSYILQDNSTCEALVKTKLDFHLRSFIIRLYIILDIKELVDRISFAQKCV